MADENTEKRKSNIIRPGGSVATLPEEFMEKLRSQNNISEDAKYIGEKIEKITSFILYDTKIAYSALIKDASFIAEKIDKISNFLTLQKPKADNSLTNDSINDDSSDPTDFSASQNFTPVRIMGFSDDAAKHLSSLIKNKGDGSDDKDKMIGGGLEKLLKIGIFSAMAFAGFVKTLSIAFDPNNPLTGVATIATKLLGRVAINILKGIGGLFKVQPIVNLFKSLFGMENITKVVKPASGSLKGLASRIMTKGFLKRIPLIGTLISFGIAFKRFRDGQFLQGAIDIASGLFTLVPGWGTALSLALDIFNAGLDIQEGSVGPAGISWKDRIIAYFTENGRDIPLIGTFVRLGEALGYLVAGNWQGFFRSGGDFLNSIPFIGYVYDLLTGAGEATGSFIYSGAGKIADSLSNLVSYFSEKINNLLQWVINKALDLVKKVLPDFVVDKAAKTLGLIPSDETGLGDSTTVDDMTSGVKEVITSPIKMGAAVGKSIGSSINSLGIDAEEYMGDDPVLVKPKSSPQSVFENPSHDREYIDAIKKQTSILEMMAKKQETANIVSMNNSNSTVSNNFSHSTNNTARRRQSFAF